MTQQEHLTTEQLSAYLDKQLTPPEQAFFDAHLQSCQRCQNALEELRRTVALLHALPQPELPRSFTLPTGISHVQDARPQPRPIPQRRVMRYALQRTVRAVSTLAAVLALIFIMSGLFANVHLNAGGSASTSAPVSSTFRNSNGTTHSPAATNVTKKPEATGTTPGVTASKGLQTRTPTPPPTPTPTPTATPNNGVNSGGPVPPSLPPFLDLGQPEGRFTLGVLLLLLSVVGIISSRRRRDTVS